MMPLLFAEDGEASIIRSIGGSEEIRRHLNSLGFVAGATVRIVSRMGNNVIVNVKETRVAVDEKMASKIMIEGGCNENVKRCKDR